MSIDNETLHLAYLSIDCKILSKELGVKQYMKLDDKDCSCMQEQLIAEAWGLA